MQTKKPRRMEVNNNLVRYNEESVEIVQYPENMEGIISSMADRFSAKRPELEKRLNEWNKTRKYLRVD